MSVVQDLESYRKYWDEMDLKHIHETEPTYEQVGKTVHGVPITDAVFRTIVDSIKHNLDVRESDLVLDLCCGNGLITTELADCCLDVTGVDYSAGLLAKVPSRDNLTTILFDVTKISFDCEFFDKILLYGGIQHLSFGQVVSIVRNSHRWLKKGGRLLLGDVPDQDRMWRFFHSKEYKKAYFESLEQNSPIIGNWYTKDWLSNLAEITGFEVFYSVNQPASYTKHYRFDFVVIK